MAYLVGQARELRNIRLHQTDTYQVHNFLGAHQRSARIVPTSTMRPATTKVAKTGKLLVR